MSSSMIPRLTPEELSNIFFSDREETDREECSTPVRLQPSPPPQQRRRGQHSPGATPAGAAGAALSKSHRDDARNATAMGDLQAAIVRIGTEVANVKVSLLSKSAAKAPSAFWARLLDASSADPAVQSTTIAFKVTPLAADVDGLKDAVAAKMLLSVAAPLLEVWAYNAVSQRWLPVDEDSALVANDKATAYHVVVP